MSKKKKSSEALPPEENFGDTYAWWPSEFAPFRFALAHAGFLMALGVVLLLGVQTNSLLWMKHLLGTLIGMDNPGDLGPMPQSYDVAVIIWCFCFVIGNALLHPSLGLIALATLRPWLDGYTFKTDNTYFLWGAILILALWGVRAVLRGEGLRYPRLTALSLAYLGVALVTSFTSIDFGETYKQLLNWSGYAAVFIITCQNLPSRRVQRFVLVAVLFGVTAQAAFAILQYYYVLPFLRSLIQAQPEILLQYFGVDHVTEEMARRFNRNRAFGTVLFPNALAGFLILALPATAMFLRDTLRQRTAGLPGGTPDAAGSRSALAAAAGLFIALLLVLFAIIQFPASYTTTPGALPWYFETYASFGISFALAMVCTAPYAMLGQRQGLRRANHALLKVALIVSFVAQAWALWLTFSRGGILSLALGCGAAALIVYAPAKVIGPVLRWAPRVCAVLIVAGLALFTVGLLPDADAQAPSRTLTTQGENITLDDLADTRSFGIRTTYWQVGWRIFADNWLTGVGLGNFKWAYAPYQYPGAGDVQEAHNGYLQAFTETGILGGLALLTFWGYFALWAAGRVRAEENASKRGMLAGLLAGLLAFLLQSAMDIHFSQPSLMFFLMLFTGLLIVWSTPERIAAARPQAGQAAIAAVLVGAALAFGLSTRPYFQNVALNRMQLLATGYQDMLQQKLDIAHYVIEGLPQEKNAMRPVRPVPAGALGLFGADIDRYAAIAKRYESDPSRPGTARLQTEDTPITVATNLVFERIWMAGIYMVEDTQPWVDELKREDARFPYDFMLALHISHWYQLYTNRPSRSWLQEAPEKYLPEMLFWSEEAVRRSPLNSVAHENLAQTYLNLWRCSPEQLDLLDKYLASAERAAELGPARGTQQYFYGHALEYVSSVYRERGDLETAEEFRLRGKAARDHGWDVLTHGMPPMPRPDETTRSEVQQRNPS